MFQAYNMLKKPQPQSASYSHIKSCNMLATQLTAQITDYDCHFRQKQDNLRPELAKQEFINRAPMITNPTDSFQER